MSIDLGLKKISTPKLEKKNLMLNLLDAKELINKLKTKNLMLLDEIKNLEIVLFVAREQTNRFTSSKFDHMLSVQKYPLNKTGLGFVDSISVPKSHSTNFVPSSKPPKIQIVKSVEVTPTPKKIRVDLKESKPKNPNLPKDKKHDTPLWICHFCGMARRTCPNYFKLQAAKRANKPRVCVPQAQDLMVLIGDLVKALNLYTNPRAAHYSNMNNNSNARVESKKFCMQKAQSN